jgi:hypothetical protein
MYRRQHIDTIRGISSPAVGFEKLRKELAAQKQATGPHQAVSVLGRSVVNDSRFKDLARRLSQEDIQHRAYRPAVIYAAEVFLQSALGTENYEDRASAFVQQATRVWPELADPLPVATNGLQFKFRNESRAALSVKLLHDEQVDQLDQERIFVREALSSGSTDGRRLKALVISLGTLELEGDMFGATPEEILEDANVPEFVQLGPVDVIQL